MKSIRKVIALLFMAAMLLFAAACDETPTYSKVSVDLTRMNSTMVYSEVSNMVTTPKKYEGRSVRMKGTFAVYEGNGRNYYACIISDATACCQQGMEFVLAGKYEYPNDYPALGTEITVTGIFDTYKEDGQMYCQLVDAVFDKN